MSDIDIIKKNRERFVAFAFASADFFIEVSHEGRVLFSLGAAKSITGIEDMNLNGKNWLELFSPYEQGKLLSLFENASIGARCGPFIVNMSEFYGNRQAVFTAIKMPGNTNFYITLGFSNSLMEKISMASDVQTMADLLDREHFIHIAQMQIRDMNDQGHEGFLSFIDITHINNLRDTMDKRLWKTLYANVESAIINASYNQSLAGSIDENMLAMLRSKTLSDEDIIQKIHDDTEDIKDVSGDIFDVQKLNITSINIALKSIDKNITIQSLSTLLEHIENNQSQESFDTLQDAYDHYKNSKPQLVKMFKNTVKRLGFDMAFQPAINPKTSEENHFEILCRFEGTNDVARWLSLVEQENLHSVFDEAMMELAFNYIGFKGGETHKHFSLNIYSQSLSNKSFIKKVKSLVKKHERAAGRLTLEINNAHLIDDKVAAGRVITDLKAIGFGICLDNVDCDYEDMESLKLLQPDLIKIAATHEKLYNKDIYQQQEILHAFIERCAEQDMAVCLKNVYSQPLMKIAQTLDIECVQGFYIAEPSKKPIYVAREDHEE